MVGRMVPGENTPKAKSTGRPLGATGEAVRKNIRRIRDDKGISAPELSSRLKALDRPIPPLGINRIEGGDRRVDVDDLMAFAAALEVSPITLLMPLVVQANDRVPITGFGDELFADAVWNWLTADGPLPRTYEEFQARGPLTRVMFGATAWPPFVHERPQHDDNLDELMSELKRRGVNLDGDN
jgi:transcriptional regulator with XRE-family HTH domain